MLLLLLLQLQLQSAPMIKLGDLRKQTEGKGGASHPRAWRVAAWRSIARRD
jgi:hypothetical protein